MAKYRKKPVIIEAVQHEGTKESLAAILRLDTRIGVLNAGGGGRVVLRIPTLEGSLIAQEGDWIIKGIQGEVYPCKPDIFAATYEAVEENNG